MRINEELRNLSFVDLRQRYQGCHVAYDGIMSYVIEIQGDDVDKIIYLKSYKRGEWAVKFDYKLLDTSRLPSQWYTTEQGGSYYLSYMPRRQYQRGYSGDNCYITNALGFKSISIGAALPYIYESYNPQKIYLKSSVEDIVKSVQKSHFKQLSPFLIAVKEPNVVGIYFRRTRIGTLSKGVFELIRPEFEQEIKEIVIHPVLRNKEAAQKQKSQDFNYYEAEYQEPPAAPRARLNVQRGFEQIEQLRGHAAAQAAPIMPGLFAWDDNIFEQPPPDRAVEE